MLSPLSSLLGSHVQVHVLFDCRQTWDKLSSSSNVHVVNQNCNIDPFHTENILRKEDKSKTTLRQFMVLKKLPLGYLVSSDSDQYFAIEEFDLISW